MHIAAPPGRVWQLLTDFAAYGDWNPFIRAISGVPQHGAQLEVRIQPPGGRAMTFRPLVIVAEPERELRWLGRLLVPRLLDGEHGFRIEDAGAGGVRFVQEEFFRGMLVPFVGASLQRTEQGFAAMNDALKVRAEQGA